MKHLIRKLLRRLGYDLIWFEPDSKQVSSSLDAKLREIYRAHDLLSGTVICTDPRTGNISYLKTPFLVEEVVEEMSRLALESVNACLSPYLQMPPETIREYVLEFIDLYPRRPIAHNVGGATFHNCFWLYLMCRCIQPTLVIESGVWKGQTSWVIRQAAPDAKLHCFEIKFPSQLAFRDEAIGYHEHDWSEFGVGNVDPQRSLIHFDDHVNQARRVEEAHRRGFMHLLFDDNFPAYQIHKDTKLIVPTIDMLFDPRIKTGVRLDWFNQGDQSCTIDETSCLEARGLIAKWQNFPTVEPESQAYKARLGGHGANSKFAYVQLEPGGDSAPGH